MWRKLRCLIGCPPRATQGSVDTKPCLPLDSFRHRQDIDGLRALAVMAVLLYHAGVGLPGGFVGVDVFFVISGFVITGLILRREQGGGFQLGEFWGKRIRRIIPAASCVVLVSLLAGYFLLLPRDLEALGASAVAQQLMLSNVYFWRNTSYFAGPADLKPLLHTWSLAVEEQFYLFFPLLHLGTRRWTFRARLLVMVGIAMASFLWNVFAVGPFPSATFYLLPSRSWEILAGAITAMLLFRTRPDERDWHNNLLAGGGMAAMIAPMFLYSSQTTFPGIAALLPCLGTAAFLYANHSRPTALGRLLSTRPVVVVGLMSYSLYLWHWPILAYLKWWSVSEPSTTARLIALAASFPIAFLSWRLIETPFRTGQLLAGGVRIVGFAGVVFLLVAGGGAFAVLANGWPERLDSSKVFFADAERDGELFHNDVAPQQLSQDQLPVFGEVDSQRVYLVLGDSHAMALMPGIDAAARACGVKVLQSTRNSTLPLLGFRSTRKEAASPELAEAITAYIRRNDVDLVVLAGYWCREASSPEFAPSLERMIRFLSDRPVSIALVMDVAKQPQVPPRMMIRTNYFGEHAEPAGISMAAYRALNEEVLLAFRRFDGERVSILEPASILAGTGFWLLRDNGIPLYRDRDHLSVEGALRLVPMFKEWFDVTNPGSKSAQSGN